MILLILVPVPFEFEFVRLINSLDDVVMLVVCMSVLLDLCTGCFSDALKSSKTASSTSADCVMIKFSVFSPLSFLLFYFLYTIQFSPLKYMHTQNIFKIIKFITQIHGNLSTSLFIP
jgi:hypothetical protein